MRVSALVFIAGGASALSFAGRPSALRPAFSAVSPTRSRLPLLSEAAKVGNSAADEVVCIEDGESVEECTLISWDRDGFKGEIKVPKPFAEKLTLGAMLITWFALNVMYNITLKRASNVFSMPWTLCVTSLFVGIPLVGFLWGTGLRKPPTLYPGALKTLIPIGAAHALGHAGAVISIGAGAVSFAHTVKSAEPVFTCILSYFFLGTVFKWQVYASLMPIMFGVALSSLKELSFTMKALYGALLSNVAFATRAVLSKKTMSQPVGSEMTPANLYAMLTIIAFFLTIPFAAYYELSMLVPAWNAAVAKVGAPWLTKEIAMNGLYFYLYNEVAFKTLDKVAPVTHSIANTIKRVAIILASVMFLGSVMTPLGAAGSGVAILGTFVYSIAKSKYK